MKLKLIKKSIIIFFLINNIVFAEDLGSGGKFIIKGKLQGVIANPKNDKKSKDSNVVQFYPGPTENKNFSLSSNTSFGNNLGIAASAAYFLSDNLALEASVGYSNHKIKMSGQGPQYVGGEFKENQSFNQYTKATLVPFALMVQYHIAPYGTISPYVGAGYNYSFAVNTTNAKIKNSKGFALQAGFDGWINDHMLYNVEIKKLFISPTINFRNNFAVDEDGVPLSKTSQNIPFSKKVQLNPLVISGGIGLRF